MDPAGLSPGSHTHCLPAALVLGTRSWGSFEGKSCLVFTRFTSPGWSWTVCSEALLSKGRKEASTEKACSPGASPSAGVGVVLTPPLTSHLQVGPGYPSPDLCPAHSFAREFNFITTAQTLDCKALSFLGLSPPSNTPEAPGTEWVLDSAQ